jgi:spermidine/putrescine-binding protein
MRSRYQIPEAHAAHFGTTTAAMAALALRAPAAPAKKPALNIFCWSEYIAQSIVDAFAKANGVKVNVENYGSNEEMLAKLQAGGSKYDLIQPSDYVIEEMIKDGRLEELDLAAIPNREESRSEVHEAAARPGREVLGGVDGRLGRHRGEHRQDQGPDQGVRRFLSGEIQAAPRGGE